MELHHSKHHNAYVTNYNSASEQLQEAVSKDDIAEQISLKQMINFNGGITFPLLNHLLI